MELRGAIGGTEACEQPMDSESSDSIVARAGGAPPLRILFVVDGYYPATGGAEKQVRTLARAFADAGHTVRIVAPWLDRSLPQTDQVDGIPV